MIVLQGHKFARGSAECLLKGSLEGLHPLGGLGLELRQLLVQGLGLLEVGLEVLEPGGGLGVSL